MKQQHVQKIRASYSVASAIFTAFIFLSLSGVAFTQAASSADTGNDYQTRTFLTSDGSARKYLLRLPKEYQATGCTDVVFDFHGAGSSAEREFAYTGFPVIADRENFILVYPDANKEYIDQNHQLASYWNNAWEAVKRERDYDVNFVLELVEQVKDEFCTEDIFATGMSAGGDMTSALACLESTPFKSFAPVTYRYYYAEECAVAGPRPILSFQGDQDRVVPIEGSGAPWFDPPMTEIMRRWAAHNQCNPVPLESRVSGEVVHFTWQNCAADTEWYLVEGGGHTWPGTLVSRPGNYVTQDIDASELIYSFFKR